MLLSQGVASVNLASFVVNGRESFGLIEGDTVIDLAAHSGLPTLRAAIAAGTIMSAAKAARGTAGIPLSNVTLLPPIPEPEKIICIGLNYRAHAEEGGKKLPEFPSLFLRLTNTLVASGAPLVRPLASSDFDFEGELAIVIGKGGRRIAKSDALNHVFGYTCFNDGSIRDLQFKHTVTVGKNFPSTGGIGPWITTADEIPDPSKLTLTTRLNGQQVQHKGVDDLIFDVPTIIEYVSGWTKLSPGDLIATGTPEGVGFARKPPLWLKPGDTIEVEISKIGVLSNNVVAEK
jgi:2-keto-4-pentenoate hydratase/2-oxohepta-3-ene-1,7-dioic acid hydratase in catechol pathway